MPFYKATVEIVINASNVEAASGRISKVLNTRAFVDWKSTLKPYPVVPGETLGDWEELPRGYRLDSELSDYSDVADFTSAEAAKEALFQEHLLGHTDCYVEAIYTKT